MSNVEAILEHPILRVAVRVIRPGADESFELDERGALLIQHGLLKYADDPSLPTAVQGLFGLVTGLFERARSPTAARRLLEIVLATRPHLPALRTGSVTRAVESAVESAAESLRKLEGNHTGRTAPMHDSAGPEGSVRVASLTGLARPLRR